MQQRFELFHIMRNKRYFSGINVLFSVPLVYCEEQLCREGFDGTISCASPLKDDFPQSAGLEESIERTRIGEEAHGKSHGAKLSL